MTHPEHQPRGRHVGQPHENSALPSEVLRRAEQLTADHLEHAHQEIGDALFAYLMLSDVNSTSDSLVNDFYAAYRGDHATLDEALRAQLDGLGWSEALRQMMHANGIAEDLLVWDLDLIKAQMDQIYDFVDYDGRTYLFLS